MMYSLPYFTENDQQKLIAFMKENAFAIITGSGDQFPVATHIPLEIKADAAGGLVLSGHLMKNTDHHKAFEKNNQVLVIFNGAHCYVSASWYKDPAVASTWNYMTVHVHGKIIFTDEAGTYAAIRSITDKYEGEKSAAAFDHIPEDYKSKLLKAIVGFTIEVSSINNVFKLSQNHDTETRLSIIEALEASKDQQAWAIAAAMKNNLKEEQTK